METRKLNFKKDWKEDKEWVDLFEPKIKEICGRIFITTAPRRLDIEEATDLLVLEIKPLTIACRVRRHNYYFQFDNKNEFTIRKTRPSGYKSEFAKICEGWGDYYFYAFSNGYENGSGFRLYTLFNLKVFRREWIFNNWKKHLRFKEMKNKDGSSNFYAFKIKPFPQDFIMKGET